MRSARLECFRAAKVRGRLGAEDNHPQIPRLQAGVKRAGVQVVLLIVEPAVALDGQIEIAIPVVRELYSRTRTQQIVRRRALKSLDVQAVLYRLDVHSPVASLGRRVVVTIIDQGLDGQVQRLAGANELVLDVRRVSALLHP